MYLTVCFLITPNIEHLSLVSGRKIYSLITQIAWKSPRVLQSDVQGCPSSNSSKKILVGRFLWIISICYLVLTWSIPSKPLTLDLLWVTFPRLKAVELEVSYRHGNSESRMTAPKNVNSWDSQVSEKRKQILWMTQDGKIRTAAVVAKSFHSYLIRPVEMLHWDSATMPAKHGFE